LIALDVAGVLLLLHAANASSGSMAKVANNRVETALC
jgi:hypothetical protein